MSTARSVFTEAIEDHLALKKQNVAIEAAMPLARYDVGDPLDRYPGGPNRAAEGTVVVAEDVTAMPEDMPFEAEAIDATQMMVGPSPEQAMEAAIALDPTFADRPFEPLTGMTPMLSLVEDIEDEDDDVAMTPPAELPSGDVLRFPGGVGPRDEVADVEPQQSFDTQSIAVVDQVIASGETEAIVHDAPTGEQPVLVIDTDEPLATSDFTEPGAPVRGGARRKPRFFGLGRKKSSQDGAGEGWFTDGPRDFNWD